MEITILITMFYDIWMVAANGVDFSCLIFIVWHEVTRVLTGIMYLCVTNPPFNNLVTATIHQQKCANKINLFTLKYQTLNTLLILKSQKKNYIRKHAAH